MLSEQTEDFAYANLAVRGRLLQQILDEQVEPALELRPDLITVSMGGNDVIRPGTDPDEIAARFEGGIERLSSQGATVVMFNGPDIGMTPVMRRIRGKVAIYNENLRTVAQKHDAIVADMWSLRELTDPRMWAPDRLHFSPSGTRRSPGWCCARSTSRTTSSPSRPSRCRGRPGVRPGARTSAGRVSTSRPGSCGGCATSRRVTASSRSARPTRAA